MAASARSSRSARVGSCDGSLGAFIKIGVRRLLLWSTLVVSLAGAHLTAFRLRESRGGT
jgi:hypothetical protein